MKNLKTNSMSSISSDYTEGKILFSHGGSMHRDIEQVSSIGLLLSLVLIT